MRVQIPAYTDAWMQGDRFGSIARITTRKRKAAGTRAALLTDARSDSVEIAHVKMDISGRMLRVILDDCTPV